MTRLSAAVNPALAVFADVGRNAFAQVRSAARELFEGRLPGEQADSLAQKLSEGTWTHDYPISAAEAKVMGLSVSTRIPSEILELLSLYPQPLRAQGGLEYLPVPRQALAHHSAPQASLIQAAPTPRSRSNSDVPFRAHRDHASRDGPHVPRVRCTSRGPP